MKILKFILLHKKAKGIREENEGENRWRINFQKIFKVRRINTLQIKGQFRVVDKEGELRKLLFNS